MFWFRVTVSLFRTMEMLGDEDGGNKGGNYKQKNIFAEHASFDADEGDGGGAWVCL